MADESLAQPDLLAELPDDADYDRVYAVLASTERGRRFLIEFAARNRTADTNMLVGAIARVEAAVRGDPSPQIPAIVIRELVEIGAAVNRIKAEMPLIPAPVADVSAAIERIQDIAFVLHERPVETTLCDRLDAALREICGSLGQPDSAADGLRKAVELLAALARRLNALVALAIEKRNADPADARAAPAAALPLRSHESQPGMMDREILNEAVTALAASAPGQPQTRAMAQRHGEAGTSDFGAADPLAAIRALSEDELIALFS